VTERQKAIRSVLRSVVFLVIPAVLPLISPEFLQEWGVPQATAVLVTTLIGAIARALMPQAFTPKS
jgi:putative effector of murein hydrolase LrgA (UPF0299 family)